MARPQPDHEAFATRDKLILSGLYLSKFDKAGLENLGLESFSEAFNVIGYALGSKPASVKNYRDEFDPLFPNKRKGWHNRQTRTYCRKIYEEYSKTNLDDFTGLLRSFFNMPGGEALGSDSKNNPDDENSAFAQRLITGQAAEKYFEEVHSGLTIFGGLSLENTTRFGCGYDYRLHRETRGRDFLAVEVKGLKDRTGAVALTPKEYDAASTLKERFFLFVVRNFCETPYHSIFQDPISSELSFKRSERMVVQTSWVTKL